MMLNERRKLAVLQAAATLSAGRIDHLSAATDEVMGLLQNLDVHFPPDCDEVPFLTPLPAEKTDATQP